MARGALAGPAKKAAEEGATSIWVDESAFYRLAHLVRTWAPRGQTPRLDVKQTKDHLAAIRGITRDGRRCLQVREGSYDSGAVVGFLRVLLRKVRGRILLIWDGAPSHRGQTVRGFLRSGAAKRLHLEQLPGYAPDRNRDAGLWNDLKRVELANVCCRELDELQPQVLRARERLRHKRDMIRACSRQGGYADGSAAESGAVALRME
jgi:transposase